MNYDKRKSCNLSQKTQNRKYAVATIKIGRQIKKYKILCEKHTVSYEAEVQIQYFKESEQT